MKRNRNGVCQALSVLMLSWCTYASAQDAVAVDPQHHKVEFENAHVRVLRIAFGPGESSRMHSHPCAVAIGLSDSLLTFHLPDGSTRPAKLGLGQVIAAKPQTHNPANDTAEKAEVILVELKDSGC
jgi:quercetin dioxygenase-like cupin family protein